MRCSLGFLLDRISINSTLYLSLMFLMPTSRPLQPGRECSPSGLMWHGLVGSCSVLSQAPHPHSSCQLFPQVSAVHLLLYILSGCEQGGRDFLPEKDPLEVGSGVKGVGRNSTNLVILQVQILQRWGEPLRNLCELIPSDVQQLQGLGGMSRIPPCTEHLPAHRLPPSHNLSLSLVRGWGESSDNHGFQVGKQLG